MPVIHDSLTGPDAIHPVCFVGATDPSGTPANQVGPYKMWLDTTVAGSWVMKIRNAANTGWDAITVTDHGALQGLADDDHPQYLTLSLVDAKGDLLVATAADTVARFALGTSGHVLTSDPTTTEGIKWAAPVPSLTNPMTTAEDLIVGGTAGDPQRVGKGSDGQVLTVVAGEVDWADPTGGMANPMTAIGDLILGGASGAATRLAKGTLDGYVLQIVSGAVAWGAAPLPPGVEDYATIEFTFGNGVDALTTSEPAQWVELPFDGTIERATLVADISGGVVLDVQVTDYAGWPADASDSICGSAKPTLSSAIKSQDTTLTGWTTALTQGQFMRVAVDSAATLKRVVLSLYVEGTPV